MSKHSKKEFALVNIYKKIVVMKRNGEPYLAKHPKADFPKGFTWKSGVSWEPVEEIVTDPHHVGKPIYLLPDHNVARVRKIQAPQKD